jgi:hypothetical protein
MLSSGALAPRQACWSCLRALPPAWLACGACALARYCSVACRGAHAGAHAAGCECGRPWPALLPARAVLAARLARLVAAVGRPPPPPPPPVLFAAGQSMERSWQHPPRLRGTGRGRCCGGRSRRSAPPRKGSPCGPPPSTTLPYLQSRARRRRRPGGPCRGWSTTWASSARRMRCHVRRPRAWQPLAQSSRPAACWRRSAARTLTRSLSSRPRTSGARRPAEAAPAPRPAPGRVFFACQQAFMGRAGALCYARGCEGCARPCSAPGCVPV